MNGPGRSPSRAERGATIAELMVALVVLSVGILAVGQLFPAASRSQQQARMTSAANYYAQERLEELRSLTWTATDLTDGRHPASGYESPASSGQYQRYYQVTTMSAPLGNLKKVAVTVQWGYLGPHAVTSTTYVRR